MRFSQWLAAVVGVGIGLATVFALAAERPPNVVLIMADDFGYECVGANGSTQYQTPTLDRLAATGVRFERCYAQPLCTPTRVELMTGLYNQRNYLRFGLLDPQATTFAQVFKRAGYATCIAGKWQLGGGLEGPGHFGFDEYCLWQVNRRPSRYVNPGLEINGKQVDYHQGEYGPDIVCDYLCDFIERHRDKPFLAYYPMMLTHAPFEPTPASPDWDPKAEGGDQRSDKKHFGDMVHYMDKLVGKVMAKLDALGLRENTLIVFLGDNGTNKGIVSQTTRGPVAGNKGSPIETGMHVPLIVNWKGTSATGAVCPDLVDTTDFFPTLLAAAGIETPSHLQLDGRSFLPQVRGEKGNPRQWIYCWYNPKDVSTVHEFARDERYKLNIHGKLFDLQGPGAEAQPIPDEQLTEEARAARKKLQAVLDQFHGTRPEKLVKMTESLGKPGQKKKGKGKAKAKAANTSE